MQLPNPEIKCVLGLNWKLDIELRIFMQLIKYWKKGKSFLKIRIIKTGLWLRRSRTHYVCERLKEVGGLITLFQIIFEVICISDNFWLFSNIIYD